MKIAFFVNRDIHANLALNLLRDAVRGHDVSLFLSDKVGKAPAHELLDLLRLVEQDIPNDHVFPGIRSPGELLSFDALGREWGTTPEVVQRPNDPEFVERLRAMAPDLMISIRYGRIFKDAAIEVPKLGILNLHSGRLPHYRGVLATFRALLNGDDEIGCTLHFIPDGTIDTGPVVAEARVPVDPDGSLFGHVASLYPPGAKLIEAAISRLSRGETLETLPPSTEEGSYFSFPDENALARYAALGMPVFKADEYRKLLGRY